MIYVMGDAMADTPNLDAVMDQYGMTKTKGYIADTQRNYQGNYYYIFPEISASGDLGDGLENNMVLLVNSAGFTVKEDLGDTLTVDEVMTTSPDGYAVTEDEQTQGEYTLAAVAQEGEAKLTVIASESMINSQITDYFSNLDNKRLFVNMVLNNFDDVENLSIDPKSLSVEMNTVQHAGSISTALIFGVPAVVLIGGFVIWMKRRKA